MGRNTKNFISDNRRIARNSILLYIRMIFIMCIGFYTSRVVLEALGIDDYGIFSLVGGLISIISVLNSSLASASSRFITYALGQGDKIKLKEFFSTSYALHFYLSVIFLLICETLGLWFVNTQLNIAIDRIVAANWVYQSAIWSTAFNITQVPYNACITSHEKFDVFAFVEVLNAVLKLGIAFAVLYTSFDHLILYSILYALISLMVRLIYHTYCVRNFEECKMSLKFDKTIMKEMLSFSGWGLVNSGSMMVYQQGTNFFINRFFGVWLNAAFGVAQQVQGLLYTFINNVNMAFSPQIIKEYARGNYSRVNQLVNMGAQFSAFVTILISIPVIVCMPFLMGLWLKSIPEGAVIICQILLVVNIFNSFNSAPFIGVTAAGKIKWMNIFCSIIYFFMLLLIYVVLNISNSYLYVYLLGILPPITTGLLFIFILKSVQPSFNAVYFLFKTYIPLLLVSAVSYFVSRIILECFVNEWLQVLSVVVVSALTTSSLYCIFIMPKEIKIHLKHKMNTIIGNNFKLK